MIEPENTSYDPKAPRRSATSAREDSSNMSSLSLPSRFARPATTGLVLTSNNQKIRGFDYINDNFKQYYAPPNSLNRGVSRREQQAIASFPLECVDTTSGDNLLCDGRLQNRRVKDSECHDGSQHAGHTRDQGLDKPSKEGKFEFRCKAFAGDFLELRELIHRMSQLQELPVVLDQEICNVNDELNEKSRNVKALQVEKGVLQDNISIANKSIEALEKQEAEMLERYENLETVLAEAEADLQVSRAQNESISRSLQDQYRRGEFEISDLNQKCEDLREKLMETDCSLRQSGELLEQEREELSYVQRKHEELVERAQSLEASLDHFREELQTSRSHAEKSTTCLHDVRKVLTDASCEMKQLSGIMAPLESQFLKIQQGKQTALRLCAEKISAAEALIAGQSSLVHYQKTQLEYMRTETEVNNAKLTAFSKQRENLEYIRELARNCFQYFIQTFSAVHVSLVSKDSVSSPGTREAYGLDLRLQQLLEFHNDAVDQRTRMFHCQEKIFLQWNSTRKVLTDELSKLKCSLSKAENISQSILLDHEKARATLCEENERLQAERQQLGHSLLQLQKQFQELRHQYLENTTQSAKDVYGAKCTSQAAETALAICKNELEALKIRAKDDKNIGKELEDYKGRCDDLKGKLRDTAREMQVLNEINQRLEKEHNQAKIKAARAESDLRQSAQLTLNAVSEKNEIEAELRKLQSNLKRGESGKSCSEKDECAKSFCSCPHDELMYEPVATQEQKPRDSGHSYIEVSHPKSTKAQKKWAENTGSLQFQYSEQEERRKDPDMCTPKRNIALPSDGEDFHMPRQKSKISYVPEKDSSVSFMHGDILLDSTTKLLKERETVMSAMVHSRGSAENSLEQSCHALDTRFHSTEKARTCHDRLFSKIARRRHQYTGRVQSRTPQAGPVSDGAEKCRRKRRRKAPIEATASFCAISDGDDDWVIDDNSAQ